MLEFEQILKQYPEYVRPFRENILKEYLQCLILDIVYRSKYARKLVFMGGTAIRIVHQSVRFSEDLDFDNQGLKPVEYKKLADLIAFQLEKVGYQVEIKTVLKGAFHCYVRFPGLLFANNLSSYKESKILIQLDAEPQRYDFNAEKFVLNRFSIFRFIKVCPPSLLLSQKISAIFNRKRTLGRDFFDVVFLAGIAEPDFSYLRQKCKIPNKARLNTAMIKKCATLNFTSLAKDVEPFLIDPGQVERIKAFPALVKDNMLF